MKTPPGAYTGAFLGQHGDAIAADTAGTAAAAAAADWKRAAASVARVHAGALHLHHSVIREFPGPPVRVPARPGAERPVAPAGRPGPGGRTRTAVGGATGTYRELAAARPDAFRTPAGCRTATG